MDFFLPCNQRQVNNVAPRENLSPLYLRDTQTKTLKTKMQK